VWLKNVRKSIHWLKKYSCGLNKIPSAKMFTMLEKISLEFEINIPWI
jgi:hypothetical protein